MVFFAPPSPHPRSAHITQRRTSLLSCHLSDIWSLKRRVTLERLCRIWIGASSPINCLTQPPTANGARWTLSTKFIIIIFLVCKVRRRGNEGQHVHVLAAFIWCAFPAEWHRIPQRHAASSSETHLSSRATVLIDTPRLLTWHRFVAACALVKHGLVGYGSHLRPTMFPRMWGW